MTIKSDGADMMPLSEAAKRLGRSTSTLAKQARVGRLRAVKVGPIWLVSPQEVERYRSWSLGRPGRKSEGEQ